MFGFTGSYIGRIVTDANGETLAGSRPFYVSHAVLRADLGGYNTGEFDIESVGVSPQQQAKTSNVFVAITSNPRFVFAQFSDSLRTSSAGYTFTWWKNVPVGGIHTRGWNFTNAAALTPPTRKHRFNFFKPDFVKAIAYIDNSASGSQSNTSNPARGTLYLNMAQFPNASILSFGQSFISELQIVPSKMLEQFFIESAPNLAAINGKLPDIKSVQIANTLLANINFLSESVNIKHLNLGAFTSFPTMNSPNSALTGIIDLSTKPLEELAINGASASVTDWILPNHNNWLSFVFTNMGASARPNFDSAHLDNILNSANLTVFTFFTNSFGYNKAIGNSEISANLILWWSYQNSWSGNITITAAKPNVKEFKTGNNTTRTGTQQNSHPVVNITGLTGALTIDLSGSNIEDLQLPLNTVCTSLTLFDNKLDIVTNPDLINQIRAMVQLTDLRLGNGSTSSLSANNVGQNSANGLGANVNLNTLVNLVTLNINSCLLTGALTLPNINKITSMSVSFNPGLTNFVNLLAHTGLLTLRTVSCLNLSFSITSAFTSLQNIDVSNSGITLIDLSGRTSTTNNLFVLCNNSPDLVSIVMPTTLARSVVAPTGINWTNCTLLASATNLENINYTNTTATNNLFRAENCSLNQLFPFGSNSFIPNVISLQDNGMSSANVDSTINNIYTNKTKWNSYTVAKSINIAGSNAAASGIYQAPAGFVLGVSDGAPASAKEQIYVLVNNYGWTITYN